MGIELLPKAPSMFDSARDGGPLGLLAFAAMVISGILALIWLLLWIKDRRRPSSMLLVTAIVLGAAGGLYHDWHHISLNFALRDPDGLRKDCIELLQRRHSLLPEDMELHLFKPEELPLSFTRLGAKAARVTSGSVLICLKTDWNAGASGFLYAPKSSELADRYSYSKQFTWSHDFYTFQIGGE